MAVRRLAPEHLQPKALSISFNRLVAIPTKKFPPLMVKANNSTDFYHFYRHPNCETSTT